MACRICASTYELKRCECGIGYFCGTEHRLLHKCDINESNESHVNETNESQVNESQVNESQLNESQLNESQLNETIESRLNAIIRSNEIKTKRRPIIRLSALSEEQRKKNTKSFHDNLNIHINMN